jgi:hypothetical protein
MFRPLPILAAALLAVALAVAAPARAQSDDPAASKVPAERSDRLDVFGAGMCHTCEWRPRERTQRSAEQCGVGDDGQAKVALFECGRNPACETVCNFVRCE